MSNDDIWVVSLYFTDGSRRYYKTLEDAVAGHTICGQLIRNNETKVVTVCERPFQNTVNGRCFDHGGQTIKKKEYPPKNATGLSATH